MDITTQEHKHSQVNQKFNHNSVIIVGSSRGRQQRICPFQGFFFFCNKCNKKVRWLGLSPQAKHKQGPKPLADPQRIANALPKYVMILMTCFLQILQRVSNFWQRVANSPFQYDMALLACRRRFTSYPGRIIRRIIQTIDKTIYVLWSTVRPLFSLSSERIIRRIIQTIDKTINVLWSTVRPLFSLSSESEESWSSSCSYWFEWMAPYDQLSFVGLVKTSGILVITEL